MTLRKLQNYGVHIKIVSGQKNNCWKISKYLLIYEKLKKKPNESPQKFSIRFKKKKNRKILENTAVDVRIVASICMEKMIVISDCLSSLFSFLKNLFGCLFSHLPCLSRLSAYLCRLCLSRGSIYCPGHLSGCLDYLSDCLGSLSGTKMSTSPSRLFVKIVQTDQNYPSV